MTNAPADLLVVRSYLRRKTGLEPSALGIAGDAAHAAGGGYHMGNDDLLRAGRLNDDYSKRESSRDRPGTNGASAIDIGDFAASGETLRRLSVALVNGLRGSDSRLRDVREVICTLDGRSVVRWDRLGLRSTGDNSHLFHTHASFFRDSEGRRDRADNFLGWLVEFFEGELIVSALTDEIIDHWRRGVPEVSDKIDIEPVHWRIRDEAWQAAVNLKLSELASAVGRVVVDGVAVAAALKADAAFMQSLALAVAAAVRPVVDEELDEAFRGADPRGVDNGT